MTDENFQRTKTNEIEKKKSDKIKQNKQTQEQKFKKAQSSNCNAFLAPN